MKSGFFVFSSTQKNGNRFRYRSHNTEIESFGDIEGINVNTENIKHIANIKTRRLIKLLSNTDNIETFMR